MQLPKLRALYEWFLTGRTQIKWCGFAPFFPKRYGGPRGDGQQVLNSIIFINGTGLRERDTSWEYDPSKTLYSRGEQSSDIGEFFRVTEGLAAGGPDNKTISIDAIHLKALRTTSSLPVRKGGGVDVRKIRFF